jgi:DnaJ family protein C protein 3
MQRAVEMDQGNQQAREGLGRAQRLLKMSKRKDYYKILGVARTATDRDIKKSFRKLALQWHPDKHPVDKKDEVEKMFRDISEANEVLSDPVKKQKYDNGEDLEEQPQQQGNPFGFGFPGGFQFHFQRGG